ncbi:MAG: TolC family protein [Burkholderiaceae bacterium]|nr:TolC family protein [Burkholderiaceae bacterium]
MKFITPVRQAQLLALVLTAFALTTTIASAQPVWTFDQVLQSVLASHPALQGKRSAQAAARSDFEGAQWQRYPTLSVESAAPTSGGSSGLVRIEQPLWTGGRITAGIDATSSRIDAAGAALDEERLNLSLRVIAAFTESMRQKARQQYAAKAVAEHVKLLEMILRRVARDVSSLPDQRLAESRMLQAANDQSAADQAFNNSLVQLTQLAGAPVEEVATLEAGELAAPPTLDAALAQALAYSPVLRRLTHEEEAAMADIASRRSTYTPQLALRLEKTMGQFNDGRTHDSRVMLVLLAQPGAGLSAVSGVNAALARREAAHMAREAAERDTRERVTLDWNEWAAARLRLENASQSSDMSSQVFESYTRQYVIGRKTWNDVLNAVREVTQSQFALEDARAQAIAASLRLAAQSGTLRQHERSKP